jgi:hypothetical protein
MDSNALSYIINHLFLPPKLPQEDDTSNVDGQYMLLSHVAESANDFLRGLQDANVDIKDQQCWRVLERMLRQMCHIHRGTQLSPALLQKAVCDMNNRGPFTYPPSKPADCQTDCRDGGP